jgi:hypothetical protein
MAHVFLVYQPADQRFALQLATQLQQRGLIVWPVPDPDTAPAAEPTSQDDGFKDASHFLIVAAQSSADLPFADALAAGKHVITVLQPGRSVPPALADCPAVDFQAPFLVAVEELVQHLTRAHAPIRQLTFEHPPPVVKAGLLPIALPAERCWRDDRMRINYILPMVISDDDVALRLPAFFVKTGFTLTDSQPHTIRAARKGGFPWFDPRRVDHTLTIEPREGMLLAFYQMTRTQVRHWFPAHYHVLDREAAALYRYLAMENLDNLLIPVQRQARRAVAASYGSLIGAFLFLTMVIYLILT